MLICKTHHNGITDVIRHFQSKDHAKMTTKTRLQIRAATQNLNMLEPNSIVAPPPTALPIDELELIKNGFKCKMCGSLAGTLSTIKVHCRAEHDWEARDGIMWTTQAVQTFFSGNSIQYIMLKAGFHTSYFAVTLPTSTENQTMMDQLIEGQKIAYIYIDCRCIA